jgi:Tfp pilus assembly PilM family ATPase
MSLFGKNISVGLEMGNQLLRAVQIQHRQGRPRLLAVETQQYTASSAGALSTEGPVWQVVKLGRKADRLVVNVPGSVALVRIVKVEASEMSNLRDWVMWEAQQYLAAPLEEYFIDFQKLRSYEKSGLWEVLVVAARHEAVRERARLFKAVDLKPAIMDTDPLALHNAFEVNYPSQADSPVALVNLERDVTIVLAIRGGGLQDVFTMETPAESEKLCQRIRTCLDNILRHVTPDQGEGEGLVKILLSGGGPHMQEVVVALSSDGQMQVELADPFRELTIMPTLREKLDQSCRASEFMLATGLALRKT